MTSRKHVTAIDVPNSVKLRNAKVDAFPGRKITLVVLTGGT